MSEVHDTKEGVCDLLIKEQFLSVCSNELSLYLNTNPTSDLKRLATLASNFIEARGKRPFCNGRPQENNNSKKRTGAEAQKEVEERPRGCFRCGKDGHKAAECRTSRPPFSKEKEFPVRRCYICQQVGHLANTCS